jgi:hypothetical protein
MTIGQKMKIFNKIKLHNGKEMPLFGRIFIKKLIKKLELISLKKTFVMNQSKIQ